MRTSWKFKPESQKRLKDCLTFAGSQPCRSICELILATGHGQPNEIVQLLAIAYHTVWQTMQRMERAGVLESEKKKGSFRTYVVVDSQATRNLRYFIENFEA